MKIAGSVWRTLAAATVMALTLSGCGTPDRNKLDEHALSRFGKNKVIKDQQEKGDYDSAIDAGRESSFSFGSEDGFFGSGGGGGKKSKQDVRADMLFASALDVVMDFPIAIADRNGKFISTDWKVGADDPTTRYRVNIRVSGEDPYGTVNVTVLKQRKVKETWTDDAPNPDQAAHIEKTIRLRAKEIKL
ncbi:MAG: DUF3576 domain-containing protein [Magnetococcales bacterium]|nr:DUF3576 domain-containing protein [Magnetococcales bacterium]